MTPSVSSTPRPLLPSPWAFGLPLAALLALILLGFWVTTNPTLAAWDTAFLLRLHHYATPELNRIVAVATNLGTHLGVLPASLGFIALALGLRRWPTAAYLALVTTGSAILNFSAKLLWQRPRPALWEGVPFHSDFSFPSGHATYSMTLVLALVLLNWPSPKRPWLIGLGGFFVLAIGFSRLYLGVHFPSDIVGGWLLAITWAVGLYQVMGRWWPLTLHSPGPPCQKGF